ncbi:Protein NO VEIN-like protein [Cladobotryum mycophilum]|uniref:Protein NO VEIN-like protein n=1 Tax=Cladobotryum mycophilum TaxID=491253 RepID=A0ABR0S9F8_9HYPO
MPGFRRAVGGLFGSRHASGNVSHGDTINVKSTDESAQNAYSKELPLGALGDEVDTNEIGPERPTSEAEARDHISSIRKEKGVDTTDGPSKDLTQALNILANDLYQKPTHFLLELIQNIDDNSYCPTVIPTMNITLSHGMLRIDSNELGFTRKNVEAICRIGQTSKVNLSGTTKHIGQKGIGFKSVFKVANVVYIYSGYYFFKFDKSAPLGMLAPIWSTFPQDRFPGMTSILLELAPEYDSSDLIKELKTIDSSLLLFLRQLRNIHIQIRNSRWSWKDTLWYRPSWDVRLKRYPEVKKGDLDRIDISHGGNKSTYWVISHRVDNLPHDSRREGFEQSEVLIGFPVKESKKEMVQAETQFLYAFLPIRNVGFKCMIQADFLLVANREDIDDCSWNRTLLDSIPLAFLAAVKEFNESDNRYLWLKYLPRKSHHQTPFAEIAQKVLHLLSEHEILESQQGVFMQPSKLIRVPLHFRDEDRTLLLPQGTKPINVLSDKYPSSFNDELDLLGVATMSTADFLLQLGNFIAKRPLVFRNMPQAWHSILARLLSNLFVENEVNETAIKKWPIIPLSNGRWATKDAGSIYFPIDSSVRKPAGLHIMEVHSSAVDSPDRVKLLKLLGVLEANKYTMAEYVLNKHQNSGFKAHSLSVSDLVYHAFVLYSTKLDCSGKKLWFACEDNSVHLSNDIYIDVRVGEELWVSSATRIFRKHRSKVHFLHQDYFKTFRGNAARSWLVNTFSIEKIPRLSQSLGEPPQHTLHGDFSLLTKIVPSIDFLSLMRDNWLSYSNAWMKGPNKECPVSLMSAISELEVDCHGRSTGKLGHTFLPRKAVLMRCEFSAKRLCSGFPEKGFSILGCDVCQLVHNNCNKKSDQKKIEGNFILQVPNPEDPEWDFLKTFGVMIKVDIKTLLLRLVQLRELRLPDSDATKSHASSIYDQIQNWMQEGDINMNEIKSIQELFADQELIFIPETSEDTKGSWVQKQVCVWDGPCCLSRIKRLSSHYPEHNHLFCTSLGIPQANIDTLADEAQRLTNSDDLERIYRLLTTIDEFLTSDNSQKKNAIPFEDYLMFPVRSPHSALPFELRAASGLEEWYIANNEQVQRSFEGLIDLLAVDSDRVDKINSFLLRVGLKSRMLSSAATEKLSPVGDTMYMQRFTSDLRKKARYLSRLVSRDHLDREAILKGLKLLTVFGVEEILTTRSVVFRGLTVQGRDEPVDVGLKHEVPTLIIFMLQRDVAENHYPAELEEELVEFCGIEASKRSLVSYLLRESDEKRIKASLKKRGIADVAGSFPAIALSDFTIEHANVPSKPHLPTYYEGVDSTIVRSSMSGAFESMNRGSFTFNLPSLRYDEKAPQFFAELYVSSILGKIMGQEYNPTIHWTSPLRTRAGFKPFSSGISGTTPSFTILDNKNIIAAAFTNFQLPDTLGGNTYPTYCIEVCVTETGLDSPFLFRNNIMDKSQPHEVFIIARVYDIYQNPGISFFADPWKLHQEGSMSLFFHKVHGMGLKEETAIWTQSSMEAGLILESIHLYTYRPLAFEEIRLMELLPGSDEDELRGKVHHYNITASDLPAYHSLSYVWGLATAGMGGHSLKTDDGIIEITPSLDLALRRLRAPGQSTWLWVDAVCINQKDNLEKKIQIHLMYHIFRLAKETIIWLGTEENDSDVVIKVLHGICSDPLPDSSSMTNSSFSQNAAAANDVESSDITIKNLQDFNQLLARSWFARVWVIQELVWASKATIVCGSSSISWDAFYMALRICEKQVDSSETNKPEGIFVFPNAGPAHALAYMRNRLKNQRRKLPLLSLLDKFSYATATLVRDKIFALLSLASEEHDDLYADYDSNLEDVVRRLAEFFVNQGQTLDLLYRSGDSKAYPLCSWMPNWVSNDRADLQTISTWMAGKKGNFQAGGPADLLGKWRPRICKPEFVLEVQGWVVDKVEATTVEALRKEGEGTIPITKIKDIQLAIQNLVSGYQYPTGETVDELVLKIPIGNASGPHRNAQTTAVLAHRDFLLQAGENDEDTNLSDTNMSGWDADLKSVVSSVPLDADTFVYRSLPSPNRMLYAKYWETALEFARRLPSSQFAITGRKYVGILPGAAAKGDQICIFPGAKVPFVLRKNASSDFYELIGECYIHGIMFGEAKLFDNMVEETFRLK